MALPDCRMRFPAGPIDFAAEVGTTGQTHDDYPAAGTQPRFDWMRLTIISLLSNQASYDEPSQYREGTAWFDLNEMALKIRKNNQWLPFSNAVLLEDGITLADLYATYKTSPVVLTSPGGSRFRLNVDDDGNLSTTKL
jgi:hypothetical protein